MPTESKDTIFNPQIPKNNKGRKVDTLLPLFYPVRRPGRLFPAVSPQGVCRNLVCSARRFRRYSRKWFCSLQVSANSRSERRWRRIISATPSSSCSRTRRSSSRCS